MGDGAVAGRIILAHEMKCPYSKGLPDVRYFKPWPFG
ncbi:MAG: hypothetical protein JWQ98_862 [Chlorobi bacterium]|nr:hypothetical protein [Chlorobiota bacterium]